MKLVNLTRNTIVVYDRAGENVLLELPTSPPSIEAQFVPDTVARLGEVPIVRHHFVLYDPLPPQKPGTLYVVGWDVILSLALKGANRDDLIAPDTARESAVRDRRTHRLIGVRQFRKW